MLLERIIQRAPVNIWRNIAFLQRFSSRKVETEEWSTEDQVHLDPDVKDADKTDETGVQKLIRVAIVGVPNVGKSTLINELVDHRVSKTIFVLKLITKQLLFRFVQYPVRFTLLETFHVRFATTKILKLYFSTHLA